MNNTELFIITSVIIFIGYITLVIMLRRDHQKFMKRYNAERALTELKPLEITVVWQDPSPNMTDPEREKALKHFQFWFCEKKDRSKLLQNVYFTDRPGVTNYFGRECYCNRLSRAHFNAHLLEYVEKNNVSHFLQRKINRAKIEIEKASEAQKLYSFTF